MEKSSREKIALLVFLLLIVCSLIGLGWYILAGHSWNVAASTIDDTVGEMEGYTAIVYPGTVEPDVQKSPESGIGDSEPAVADPGEDSERADGLGIAMTSYELRKSEPVDINALVADYEAKKAEVILLDPADLSQYEEGAILKRGSKRIGVMTIGDSATQLDVSRCMQAFERADVDFTVVLTSNEWRLGRVAGIDIAICTNDEGAATMGETRNGTFYVGAPNVGEAGVVLVSPSNVVSAKVVSNS